MAGNERLAYEIAAIYSGSPEVKKAFDDFAKLNVQGQRVVNQLDKMGSAAKNTGEQIRNSRQGAAQLGMQFNQLGTQVAAGTSPFTAFAQQIGDVGYAMSFMEGKLGAVGRFLAGPWGAALGIAAVAAGPFLTTLWEMVSGADAATEALDKLIKKQRQATDEKYAVANAEGELGGLLKQRTALEDTIAKKGRRDSNGRLMFVYKEQRELEEINKKIMEGRDAIERQRLSHISLDKYLATSKPKTERTARTRTGGGVSSAQRAMQRQAERERKFAEEFNAMRLQGAKKFQDEMDLMNQESLFDTESFYTGMETIAASSAIVIENQLMKPYEAMQESFKAIGQSVDSAFKDMLLAGGSWRDGMRSIIQSVIDQLWKMYVTQQIVGMITGGINSLLGLPKVPGKALGGPVNANQMYMVGEKGPELFMPGSSGTIIPNNKMSSPASGTGGGININVDARGSSDPAAVRAQVQQGILEAAPAIIAAAEQRTISNMRRPRLGGVMQ